MYKKFLKRLFDFFAAFIGFFLLSPIFLIITILFFFANSGKPFFFQTRPGKNEELFRIVKFKTMNDKKDINGNLLSDEQRITRVGHLVRQTSLDEIPQLLNVLKGDMSLIGPRPLRVFYLPYYTKEESIRHTIRPGITGLAQTSGFRGEIETDKDIINRVKYDIFYIENWSLLLDIKIIIQTLTNALKGEEKAY